MTVVVRQTLTDDSGVFTDGTAVDAAFVGQLYDVIDDQVHSAVNPTIKPKTITDEVVTARNGQASLNAYIGTLVSTGYLTGAADLGQDWIVIGGRAIKFQDTDVAHGITAEEDTSVWGSIRPVSGTAGGALLKGLSDIDQRGLHLYGINGGAAPTLAALFLTGAKKNGAAGGALAAGEPVIGFANYTTTLGILYGDGSLYITGGLAVGFAAQPGTDEVQVGDADFKLDYVSSTSIRLQFDANDYFQYSRDLNNLSFTVGGTSILDISSGGNITMAALPGAYLEMYELSADPSAPGGNYGRLYLRDLAGKTQLCIRFNTGLVQVISAEP